MANTVMQDVQQDATTALTSLQGAVGTIEKTGETVWAWVGKSMSILLILAAVGLGVWFIYSKSQSYDAAIAKAQADAKTFQQQLTDYQNQQKTLAPQIQAAKEKVVYLQQDIAKTETAAAAQVAQVTAPDNTAQQVQTASTQILGETPTIEPDTKFGFTQKTTQNILGLAVNYQSLSKVLDDTKKQVTSKTTIIQDQEKELTSANADLATAKTTIGDFQTAAKKQKWKNILHWVETGAIAVGTYEAGKHSK